MRKFELYVASIAALGCIGLTLYLFSWIRSFQELWPFPGLYLIELILLALAAWFFSWRDLPYSAIVIWAIAGAYLAFAFLAGFSIGFFYFPFAILFAIVGLLADLRNKRNVLWHLGMLFLGALIQFILILSILQFVLKARS